MAKEKKEKTSYNVLSMARKENENELLQRTVNGRKEKELLQGALNG